MIIVYGLGILFIIAIIVAMNLFHRNGPKEKNKTDRSP